MLNDIASNTSFFGIFITGVAYVLACAIQKRFKSSILNPLLVSCVILIIFMLVSGIDYNAYLYGKPNADGTYDGTGAIFFQNMLTPTTVCLAIPLYEKLVYLKKYPVAIIGGILAGMFACLGGVLVLSMAFGLDHTQYVTLLPKSITTAIGNPGQANYVAANAGLEGLAGQIPGLTEIHVYTKALPSSANADLMLDTTFESAEALKGYSTHPAHVAVANSKVRPYYKNRVCLDYEV